MDCPKCKREMEEGFLQSNYKGIIWVKNPLPFRMGYFKTDSIYVSNNGDFGIETVKACICKKCKIFVGDYNE